MKKTRDYWNNLWQRKDVLYQGRTLRCNNKKVDVDVTTFLSDTDAVISKIVKQFSLKKDTFNETANACQDFVVKNIAYRNDTALNKTPEFWQFPFETAAMMAGDCEDGAIFMASLMLNAGIPNWRVKVAAGYVQEDHNAPTGGHAYCLYLADKPDGSMEWEIHDWCYFEDSKVPTGTKPNAKDGGQKQAYKKVLFTFNNEFAWSDKLTIVDENTLK